MDIPLLPDIVSLFCLSIAVLLVCHKIRVPSIVGLLITGVLCGPSALGLVSNPHAVELLAEIGVVLLMFTIGMELSGKELFRLQKPVFVGGTVQVCLTVAGFTGIAMLGGRTVADSIAGGFLAALSSTAIVLSILQQRGQSESPQGRLALGVLIFQDIAIVPMMLLIPLLAGDSPANAMDLAYSAGRTLVILGGGWALAKHVVPRMMKQVMRTRSSELLLMTTLGLCLAIALGTSYLGLSLSLGALIAGLLLAESEYSLSVVESILPFKTVFTSLFFISVGMLLDVQFVIDQLPRVLITAGILIFGKALLALPALLLLGYPMRVCIIAAICVSQIGEFSFILAKTGLSYGLLDQFNYQMFLAASILTMVLTPTLINLAPKIGFMVAHFLGRHEENELACDHTSLHDHLIIMGFGVGGKLLARTAKEAGIPYVILEMNPDTVTRFRDQEPIHYGDATKPLVLEHYGIREARVLTLVISDPAAVRAATALARKLNPKLHIVVRTRFLGEVQVLRALGANDVIPEEFETAIEIFTRVLAHYLVPRQSIEGFVHNIRGENYEMARKLTLHGTALPGLASADLSGLEVSALLVEKASPLAGTSLAQSNLRRDFGVTVVGIRRGGTTLASPDGNELLLQDDRVFLFASPAALSSAMHLFKGPEPEEDDPFA